MSEQDNEQQSKNPVQRTSPPRPHKAKDPEEVDLSKINALVVEDDAGGMAIIGVMMRFLNIKAYINTTGEGVVQMAKAMRPRPDIVFCDINLPRTTGYEVLKELRAEPEFEDMLVIAVTAQDADTEIPKARAAGFDGYIGKPLNRMRFPKQLRRVLAGEEVWETY
ncbi:MAG: response regulator [Chloroflexota bacterium]